jgi:hypothetical protein
MNRRLNDIKIELSDIIEKMKNLPKIKRHMTQLNKRNRCKLVNSIAENEMGIDLFIEHSIHKKMDVLPSDYMKPIKLIKNRPDLNKHIILLNNKIDNLDDSLLNSKTYKDIYSFLNEIKSINRYLNKIKSLLNDEIENSGGGMDEIESDLVKSIEFNNQIIELLEKVSSDLKKMEPKDPYDDTQADTYCFPRCSVSANGIWMNTRSCVDIEQVRKARDYYNKTQKDIPGYNPLDKDNANRNIKIPDYMICKNKFLKVLNY